jgi:hypothetical protein
VSIIHRGAARGALALAAGLACTPAQAQTKASGAVEASHVFCASGCQVYGGQVNTDSTGAAWIMLLDAAAAPNAGAGTIAVTGCTSAAAARPCVLKWYQIAPSSTLGISDFFMLNAASRLPTSAGLVVVCSSTGPFTLTYAAHCVFSFETMAP